MQFNNTLHLCDFYSSAHTYGWNCLYLVKREHCVMLESIRPVIKCDYVSTYAVLVDRLKFEGLNKLAREEGSFGLQCL